MGLRQRLPPPRAPERPRLPRLLQARLTAVQRPRQIACAVLIACASCASSKPSPELVPGVRSDAIGLRKDLLVRCDELGWVTDIALGRVAGAESLVIAGSRGAVLLDLETGAVERAIEFETPPGSTLPPSLCRILDVDADGDFEFVRLGSAWQQFTCLNESDGRLVWVYPESRAVLKETSFGDVDADGKLEFLLTFSDRADSHVIDHGGKLVRTQSGEPDADAVLQDIGYDGFEDGAYSPLPQPIEGFERASIRWVSLRSFGEPAFVGYTATRVRLCLFDAGRRKVYEEVLASPAGERTSTELSAPFVLPARQNRAATLLVAYGPAVWAYTLR